MNAVQLDASRGPDNALQLRRLPIVHQPTNHLNRDNVTVKVCFAGVCGTDIHVESDEFPAADKVTLGHEFCGEVAAVGPGVSTLVVGDKVVINPQASCSTCHFCTRGKPNYCVQGALRSTVGFQRNGGWAEYCEIPAKQAFRVPHGMPARLAVLTEPISCVLNGYKRLGVVPTDSRILVLGAGFVGIMWASLLHFKGYRHVSISEVAEGRKEMFKRMDFDYDLYTPGELGAHFETLDTAVDGFDVVVECTGNPAAIAQAFNYLKRGGKMNVFGCHPPNSKVEINPAEIMLKELTIVGTLINPFTFPEAIDLVQNMSDRYLTYERLGIRVYDLEDFRAALDELKSGRIVKTMFKIAGEWVW